MIVVKKVVWNATGIRVVDVARLEETRGFRVAMLGWGTRIEYQPAGAGKLNWWKYMLGWWKDVAVLVSEADGSGVPLDSHLKGWVNWMPPYSIGKRELEHMPAGSHIG